MSQDPAREKQPLVDAIVVGHRPGAETARLLADLHETAFDPFRLFYCDNTGNPRSLTAAWNDLAFAGRSPYVAFLNSDVIPCPGWDRKLRTSLDEHPLVGCVIPAPVAAPNARFLDKDFLLECPPSQSDMQALAGWASEKGQGREHLYDFGLENGGFFSVMFRRRDFVSLMGFDERLRFYGQDHEIQERLRARSMKSAQVRTCPFYHGNSIATNRAIKTGEFDLAAEQRHMSDVISAIRAGRSPRWDQISNDDRKRIRADKAYSMENAGVRFA